MPIDISTLPPPPKDYIKEGFLKKTAKVAGREFLGSTSGLIEGITESAGGLIKGAGELIDYGANIFNRLGGQNELKVIQNATQPTGDWLRQTANAGFDATQEILKKSTGKESILGKPVKWVGREIVGPIMTYEAIAGKLGTVKSILKASEYSSLDLGTKHGIQIMEKVLPFVSKSIARTELQRASSQGRVATPMELGIGVVADTSFAIASHYLRKMAPELFRVGLNPKGKSAKDISEKASNAVNEGYFGTMKMIQGQARKTISEAGSKLDDILEARNDAIWRDDIIKNGKKMIERAASTGDETTVKAISSRLNSFAKSGENLMNPKEALSLKRLIGEEIANIFDKGITADPKISGQKQALVSIWQALDTAIDKISPEVSRLNQKMNLAFSLLDPIEKSLKKPIINASNIFSVFNSLPVTLFGTSAAQTVSGVAKMAESEISKFGVRTLMNEEKNDKSVSEKSIFIPALKSEGMDEINFKTGKLF